MQPDEPGSGGATAAIQEGRALARVRHPNVVTIYGAERIGTHVGLWMEFIRGRTLHEALAQGGPFEPPAVAAIGVELAGALGAVHDAGLVHGDIKAQNVMLADDGRVVLMDFGAGRDLARRPQAASAGTPMYLAPEVIRGEPLSARSDIYALGAVLFHLLTGAFPVPATDLHELRRAHDQGDPTDIRSLRPDLGRRLAAVVTRATRRDPGQRYGTAAELANDLARRVAMAVGEGGHGCHAGRRGVVGGSRARRVDPRPAEPDRGALPASGGAVDTRRWYWRAARDRGAAVREPRPRRPRPT